MKKYTKQDVINYVKAYGNGKSKQEVIELIDKDLERFKQLKRDWCNFAPLLSDVQNLINLANYVKAHLDYCFPKESPLKLTI